MSEFDNDDDLYNKDFGLVNIKPKVNKVDPKSNLTTKQNTFGSLESDSQDQNQNPSGYLNNNDGKPRVFNPNEVLSNSNKQNSQANTKKTLAPFGGTNNNTRNPENYEQQQQVQNQRVVFNPALQTYTNNNNPNYLQNSTPNEELSGFVNLNNERNLFDPSKAYNPNDEMPILDELGICPERIKEKILSVVTLNKLNKKILEDADMTGPFLIFMLFCVTLIIQKKTHFGYIYGTTLFGGFIINTIMNLMSRKETILLYNTISVLGYCMIPIVFTSFIGLFISLKAIIGALTAIGCIIMSSFTASNFFEEVLNMQSQKWLIFYPLVLFYTSFLLVTLY